MLLANRLFQKGNYKKKSRLAVFDCDGTLVDSAYAIISCMQTACSNLGHLQPKKVDIRRTVGLPLDEAITILLPSIKINQINEVKNEFNKLYAMLKGRNKIHEPLYCGVEETLCSLKKAGWLLGVATGKSSNVLKSTLENQNIDRYFITLQTADLSVGKPDPDMLLKAMRDTGAEKKRTVMIGDTSYDMKMARNAGTSAIGVTWGYHSVEELYDSGAHSVVKTFSQIPLALENLFKK